MPDMRMYVTVAELARVYTGSLHPRVWTHCYQMAACPHHWFRGMVPAKVVHEPREHYMRVSAYIYVYVHVRIHIHTRDNACIYVYCIRIYMYITGSVRNWRGHHVKSLMLRHAWPFGPAVVRDPDADIFCPTAVASVLVAT